MRRSLWLTLMLLLLVPRLAQADRGIRGYYDCTASYTSPEAGLSFCFDATANSLKRWTGSAWVVIWRIVGAADGGTGIDTSGSTGVPTISSGTWSVAAQLSATRGGTGLDTSAATGTARVDSGTWSVGRVRHATGTSLPGTCTVGDAFFKTDASAGQNVYGCTATNVWTLEGDGTGAAPSGDITSVGDCATADCFQSVAQNRVLASPDGSTGQATMRALVTADIPASMAAKTFTGASVWNGNTVGAQYGGTGQNTSASTGVPSISAGTWSIGTRLGAALGGTNIDTSTSTGVPAISGGTWSVPARVSAALGGTGIDTSALTGVPSLAAGTWSIAAGSPEVSVAVYGAVPSPATTGSITASTTSLSVASATGYLIGEWISVHDAMARTTIDQAETGWVSDNGNVTVAHDGADFQEGAASVRLTFNAAGITGLVAHKVISTLDLSSMQLRALSASIKSSVTTDANQIRFVLDDTAACTSPIYTSGANVLHDGTILSGAVPALSAATWTAIELLDDYLHGSNALPLTAGHIDSAAQAVVCVGIKINTALANGAVVRVDNIEARKDLWAKITAISGTTFTLDTAATRTATSQAVQALPHKGFQDALDAVLDGTTLTVPPGVYRLHDPIWWPFNKRLTLQGAPGAIIRFSADAQRVPFPIYGCPDGTPTDPTDYIINATFRGLTWDSEGRRTVGIYVSNCIRNVRIEENHVINWDGSWVNVRGSINDTTAIPTGVVAIGNTSDDFGEVILDIFSVNGLTVTGNHWRAKHTTIGSSGIQCVNLEGRAPPERVVFKHVSVTGNVCNGLKDDGTVPAGSVTAGFALGNAGLSTTGNIKNIVFSGNTSIGGRFGFYLGVSAPYPDVDDPLAEGIGLVISGNTFALSQRHGMLLHGGKGNAITGNTVSGCSTDATTYAPIALDDELSASVIGNTIDCPNASTAPGAIAEIISANFPGGGGNSNSANQIGPNVIVSPATRCSLFATSGSFCLYPGANGQVQQYYNESATSVLTTGRLRTMADVQVPVLAALGGQTVFSSSSEVSLASATIPAGFMTANGSAELVVVGRIANVSGAADTLTLRAKFGAVTLVTHTISLGPVASGNRPFEFRVVASNFNTVAQQWVQSTAQIWQAQTTEGTAGPLELSYAGAKLATTTNTDNAARAIELTVQWTTGGGSVEVDREAYRAYVVR